MAEYSFVLGGLALVLVAATAPLLSTVKEMIHTSEDRMAVQVFSRNDATAKDGGIIPGTPTEGDGFSLEIEGNQGVMEIVVQEGVLASFPVIGALAPALDEQPEAFGGTGLRLEMGLGEILLICNHAPTCLGHYDMLSGISAPILGLTVQFHLDLSIVEPSFRFKTPAGDLVVLDGDDEDVVALIELEGADKIKFRSKPEGLKGTGLKLKKAEGIDLELTCKDRDDCLGTTFFTVEATSKDSGETISRSFVITLSGDDDHHHGDEDHCDDDDDDRDDDDDDDDDDHDHDDD